MRVRILLRSTTLLCVAAASAFAQVRRPTGARTPTTPPTLTMLTLSHDSISGRPWGSGQPSGKVTLSGAAPIGGVRVTLTSDNAAATVPQSVTVPAGATEATFQVTTATVSTPTTVHVTARAGSVTVTDNLKVLLAVVPPVVDAGWVQGSNATQRLFRVTMSGPAPRGGLTVGARLVSGSSWSCRPPPAFTSAVVPAGATTGDITFTADNHVYTHYYWEVIYGSRVWPQLQLTVMPAVLGPVNIPTTIAGGTTVYGTVQTVGGSTPVASCAAQLSGWYNQTYAVHFGSSNPALLQVPSHGLVPPGQNQLTFAITASAVTTQQTATITVVAGGVKQVTVTVTP